MHVLQLEIRARTKLLTISLVPITIFDLTCYKDENSNGGFEKVETGHILLRTAVP